MYSNGGANISFMASSGKSVSNTGCISNGSLSEDGCVNRIKPPLRISILSGGTYLYSFRGGLILVSLVGGCGASNSLFLSMRKYAHHFASSLFCNALSQKLFIT